MFIGRTGTEAEAPIIWPPDAKSWVIEKDPNAEKDWKQEEKWVTEDELIQKHHPLNGNESESITHSMDMNLSKLGRQWGTEEPGMLQSMGSQRV